MTNKLKRKRILLAGGRGQVGLELSRYSWPTSYDVLVTDRRSLDIAYRDQVLKVVKDYHPDYVINAAAYTAVDKAESEPELADLINRKAVSNIVEACETVGAGLVHISTDYVFDGNKSNDRWYIESDNTDPLNVYGMTKLAGEGIALSAKRSVVLRTSWVYSPFGSNFVHTMHRLAASGKDIKVVSDQYGCPTAASDVARIVAAIIDHDMPNTGLFHLASPVDASWWEFAREALTLIGYESDIAKLTTEEFPLPAKRPLDTRISSQKLEKEYGLSCYPWPESLAKVSAEIVEKVN